MGGRSLHWCPPNCAVPPPRCQGVLSRHSHKFCGVLNGLDYDCWNPQHDWQLAHHYSAGRMPEQSLHLARRVRAWVGWYRCCQSLVPSPHTEVLPATCGHAPLADQPQGKERCKAALLAELGLPYQPPAGTIPQAPPSRPLLAVVSRLTQQKGLPLILRGIEVALHRGAQARSRKPPKP